VIELGPVFFLNAGNTNKRRGHAPECTVAEMGDCTCLMHATEQQMESPYGPTSGFSLLLMLENSNWSLFVERYRPYERV